MKRTLSTLALTALLAAAAPAAADAAAYKGKTKGGTSISFTLSGKKISKVSSTVPTSCVETTGSGQTRAGSELYQPPGSFVLGRRTKVRALQPAAMNSGTRATKNYTFTSRAAGAGKVTGKLEVNFSFLRPGYDIYHSYVFVCTGSSTFTASAR